MFFLKYRATSVSLLSMCWRHSSNNILSQSQTVVPMPATLCTTSMLAERFVMKDARRPAPLVKCLQKDDRQTVSATLCWASGQWSARTSDSPLGCLQTVLMASDCSHPGWKDTKEQTKVEFKLPVSRLEKEQATHHRQWKEKVCNSW